jgi:prepilin-type N-terminal cleavage/methylation domain-containing protein
MAQQTFRDIKLIRETKNEKGFTLLEIVLSMLIGAMLIVVLGAALPAVVRIYPQAAYKLDIEHDLEMSRAWLARDAHAASKYTPLSSPSYGSFEKHDYIATPTVIRVITYYYDSTTTSLMRMEEENGVITGTTSVARNILGEKDVTFTWDGKTGTLLIDIKSSKESKSNVFSRSSFLTLALRSTPETHP